MDQAVLVDADIDEGAEIGHVADHALQNHALAQVLQGLDTVLKAGGAKLRSRVPPGLFQFADDVGHRRQAEPLVGIT